MPGDPKECRAHAVECLRLASAMPSRLSKERFEELAQIWLRLAVSLENTKELLNQWGEPHLGDPTPKDEGRIGPPASAYLGSPVGEFAGGFTSISRSALGFGTVV